MNRLELHSYFMKIAHTVSERATCRRGNVGCVIVDGNKHIISTGYNGPPAGAPHEPHSHTREECTAIHAEINALSYVEDMDLSDATLYITRAPCLDCYAALWEAGIEKVYYGVNHSTTPQVQDLARHDGITLTYWPHIKYEEVK